MAKSYSDLWKEAGDLEKQGADVANAKETAAKLPFLLKDEFRKAGDPKLDQQINTLQSDTFGAAIKGLDMYKDISDPFARRNLAEQYQGGIEAQWKNATDERTRRQGVYSDYITKWTGLFGAEAAKKQDLFNNKMSVWEKEKSLADSDESSRRWNIEQAKSGKAANDKPYTEQEITATINTLKNNGTDWGTINKFLAEKGIDTSTGSYSDVQLNTAFGTGNYPLKPTAQKDISPSEQMAQMKLDEARKAGNGTESNPYSSESDAKSGDFYWSGTTKKKKKTGIFGIDWLSADQSM